MLRLAIIGAGRIGQVHARTIAGHPAAELVLIADPVAEAAARVAAGFGVRATEDIDEVYAAADVDAVVVCSPTMFHVDQIMAAVAAGKAVLTEKPVDLSVERVDQCLAAIAGVFRGSTRRAGDWLLESGKTRISPIPSGSTCALPRRWSSAGVSRSAARLPLGLPRPFRKSPMTPRMTG